MLEISSLVFNKKGVAKEFFKTKHTKYFIFGDNDLFTLSTYPYRVGALGMTAPSHFLNFSRLKIENNILVFDDKFKVENFSIYNPELKKINFYESYRKIKTYMKNKLDNRIFRKIISNLESKNFTNIIGFGPGLTPLFDDILSGILLLNSYYNGNVDVNFILDVARRKTNDISYFQLRYAAEGYVPKPVKLYLEDYIKDILLNMGDTSGIGWMLGISFFFEMEG
ncbi:hypothetical protein XO12_05960 [Marinitoga sp. 1154]|uniref:oxamate carbamoyltransferase subunit AllH family protein n=1 Tax=Marinitoga sp. 1154 TaxID=1643335 RepID=UPI00158694B6|nr:DUF2877 domain-containing protein [Marinitoga sp. 1154]NUU99663.1 hypothetical protein [Marinitoga sp. 1154]